MKREDLLRATKDKVVESHDFQCPERTKHIEEEMTQNFNPEILFVCLFIFTLVASFFFFLLDTGCDRNTCKTLIATVSSFH